GLVDLDSFSGFVTILTGTVPRARGDGMNEHFSCRNGHRWSLSLDSGAINERWVYCPACGALPQPTASLTGWQLFRRWARRNPAVVGLLACILISVATVASLVVMQWQETKARQARARQEVEQALREAEELLQADQWKAARRAVEAADRALRDGSLLSWCEKFAQEGPSPLVDAGRLAGTRPGHVHCTNPMLLSPLANQDHVGLVEQFYDQAGPGMAGRQFDREFRSRR